MPTPLWTLALRENTERNARFWGVRWLGCSFVMLPRPTRPTGFANLTELEDKILVDAKAKDFDFISLLGGGCNGCVVMARCNIEGHPFPYKVCRVRFTYAHHFDTENPPARPRLPATLTQSRLCAFLFIFSCTP